MNNYYYFATHTIKSDIYKRLESKKFYDSLSDDNKELMDDLVNNYPQGPLRVSPLDYCTKFIFTRAGELTELKALEGNSLKYTFINFLGYSFQWGASTRSFGKNSDKKAAEISEAELVDEMTNPKGSIKKLLDSSGGNLSAVKPFLPALMISLGTNTRNKSLMTFNHTGKFCFDFDKFETSKEAIYWMNKVWKGTTNIKPYMAFLSPRGKGFKVFCQVDVNNPDFKRDFGLEDREVVMKHHKVWYEGARKELIKMFSFLEDKFDISTNDPQRLTYLPYIHNPSINFKYDNSQISEYSKIVNFQRKSERNKLLKKINQNSSEITKIMKEQGITSKEDAYHLLQKSKNKEFDLELETDKFIKTIEFMEESMNSDDRVSNWVYEHFNDYHTLHKMSWVLYGVFGDLAIEQLKRLIPEDSNKLDENNNDYRWAIRSKDDYDQDQLRNLTPAAFYALVTQLGIVKDFIADNYRVSSREVSDFKLLHDYHETYIRNLNLEDEEDDNADLDEFLEQITKYVDKKKVRLPLIEELDSLTSEIKLGPSDYLDKNVMEDLFQNKYGDKRIISLRSQCGTGKNSISGHKYYRIPGRTLLAEPYRSISDQAASEAWENGNNEESIYINSSIEDTLKSFKTSDDEAMKVRYERTLRGVEVSQGDELVIHTTYNQILNIPYKDLATFDYVYIDECHTLSDGLNYRSDVISSLIYYLVEFVAKKRKCKTKIIFMSGTPNVETHVIPELMKEYSIDSLYQRIIVDKKYKVTPTIHLTHLDTKNSKDRQEAVIAQINKYIKQGRKVCHIFNKKDKMDSYIRDIQSSLSNNIKVGLFYSGSTGQCTRNILKGKLGDYDVILTTTYFMNGININKDGLTEKEIKAGKTSTQKYGVVIDLGQGHTRVSAMDAIQTINRFRNRLCHSTVFLPKIFHPDLKNSSRKFEFRKAAKTILGINKYNYHLLSVAEDLDPFQDDEDEDEDTEKMYLINEMRQDPLSVSLKDISKASKDEENRVKIVDMINKKLRLYDDWFCSLDGYHFIAKDAGFLSIIKSVSNLEDLMEITTDHKELENKIIENFLEDDKALTYLDNQLDIEKRILVKSSGKVKDPNNTTISNLVVKNLINGKYEIEGDFHVSHERAINSLIIYHLKLCYWYGASKAMDILRFILNPKVQLLPNQKDRHILNIANYVKYCKNSGLQKHDKAYCFIKGLDLLAERSYGVTKTVNSTYTSYTIEKPNLVTSLKEAWAEYYYDNGKYIIAKSKSKDKKELLKYFDKPAKVKEYDLLELHEQLDIISIYTPVKYNKNGELVRLEQIHIPKILRSPQLIKPFSDSEASTWADPMSYNLTSYKTFLGRKDADLKTEVDTILKSNKNTSNFDTHLEDLKSNINKFIDKHEYSKVTPYIETYIEGLSLVPSFLKYRLEKLDVLFSDWEGVFYNTFKTSGFLNNRDHKLFNKISSLEEVLFCKPEFELEALLPDDESVKIKDLLDFIVDSTTKPLSNGHVSYWVALDNSNKIILVEKTKGKFCKDICVFAFKNKPFILSSGSPIKKFNKGIYSPKTFERDYINNSNPLRFIKNYKFKRVKISRKQFNSYLRDTKIGK